MTGREKADAASPGRGGRRVELSTSVEVLGLAFAICFPSLLTWWYFVATAGSPATVQQAVFAIGKIVQFTFPAVFTLLVARQRVRLPWRWRSGRIEGVLSGLLILVAIVGLWLVLSLTDSALLAELARNVNAKVDDLDLATPWRYGALALFYSVAHTFLEEYYWRWFVFGRLRRRTGRAAAIVISSLGFMAHHVIVMAVYTGWDSLATYLFSFAVAVGGAYWALLYERSETLTAPWVSHLFVDVAIFSVGYALIS